jgi:hypothetical protein
VTTGITLVYTRVKKRYLMRLVRSLAASKISLDLVFLFLRAIWFESCLIVVEAIVEKRL